MPTYDYVCAACGHTFEVFEAISAGGAKACPKCCKGRAKRGIGGGAGLIFKRTGFYITDYARKGKASAECGAEKPANGCACAAEKAKSSESKS